MNRPYPLLVRSDEEEAVRKAAKLINDRIKQYKDRFSVQDDLDLVIMCCLELATDNLHQAEKARASTHAANAELNRIDDALNDAILNTEETPVSRP